LSSLLLLFLLLLLLLLLLDLQLLDLQLPQQADAQLNVLNGIVGMAEGLGQLSELLKD